MKNYGLPTPSATYVVPSAFKTNPALVALCAKIDKYIALWEADCQAFLYANSPSRIPALFLNELGWLLQAGIFASDSDQEQRIKITTAQSAHQTKGNWVNDVEPKIFGVTGIVPSVFSSLNFDWWVRSGGNPYPSTSYWSVRGGGAADPKATGMIRAGTGNDAIIGTIVQIDLGTSALTAGQIAAIVLDISGSVPAYFRVFLGYQSPPGSFVAYAGGQIN